MWGQVWTKQLIRWLENFNNIFNIVSGLLSFQDQEGNDSNHIFAFVVFHSGSELQSTVAISDHHWWPSAKKKQRGTERGRARLSRAARGGTLQNIEQRERAGQGGLVLVTGLISDDNWNKTRANYRYSDLVPVLEIRLSIEKSWWVFLVCSQCWNVLTRPIMWKCSNVIIHQAPRSQDSPRPPTSC